MSPSDLNSLARQARQWAKNGANFGLIVSRIRRKYPEVRREVIARWLMWVLGS